MAGYDSRKFSREFSKRTEANLEFIHRIVNCDKLEAGYNDEYKIYLEKVEGAISGIRQDANAIPFVQKKGKNELQNHLHNIANSLKESKVNLENVIIKMMAAHRIENDNLYEVTQLLNSLMGIAVLPYEMHKEYFKNLNDESGMSDANRGKTRKEIREEVRETDAYDELFELIMEFYKEGQWKSTYSSDLDIYNHIKEDTIVFGFLEHLRNAACHSGDNAIIILPLDDGEIIEEILFYDRHDKHGVKQEFAMRLSVAELKQLVPKVAEFYRNTKIGFDDKTSSIRRAENRVNELLKTER